MSATRIPTTPPTVSVNRVRIVDLPGLPVDDAVRGQAAYHLLSSEAVVTYALRHAAALGLAKAGLPASAAGAGVPTVPPEAGLPAPPAGAGVPTVPPEAGLPASPAGAGVPTVPPAVRREIPRLIDARLHSDDAAARAAAHAIGRRLGRNLSFILLTLHRGDAVNRKARAEWTAADWDRWSRIRRIWLGGGVMSGDLGERMVEEARALLHELGYGEALQIEITPHRGALSLMGAARYLPAGPRHALAFDFGHTMVKRARFTLDGDTLVAAEHLPSVPTHWSHRNVPESAQRYAGEDVRDFVAGVVAQTLNEHPVDSDDLVLSVAAYVRGGRLLGNGIYARMSDAYADVRAALEAAVKARTGRAVRLLLIHDGTAAAALHAGTPHAAVIIVGTALGVGFPPAEIAGLLTLADPLVVSHVALEHCPPGQA